MDFEKAAFPAPAINRPSHETLAKIVQHSVLRDNFSISTWLAVGAFAHGLLSLILPPRYAVTPIALLLLHRITRAILMQKGRIPNTQMDGVFMGKFSSQPALRDGSPMKHPSEQDAVVILLATRSNHPLGLLGPGYKDMSNHMNAMVADLWDHADTYGFLGQTTWIAANERQTNNQIMVLCYFRSVEDLHAYAHGPLHRKAWTWWSSITKTHPHLSIMHEVYHAREKQWENIYINNHLTGMAATTATVNVKGMSMQPLLDASNGLLRTQMGRLRRGDGTENEGYGPEAYGDGAKESI